MSSISGVETRPRVTLSGRRMATMDRPGLPLRDSCNVWGRFGWCRQPPTHGGRCHYHHSMEVLWGDPKARTIVRSTRLPIRLARLLDVAAAKEGLRANAYLKALLRRDLSDRGLLPAVPLQHHLVEPEPLSGDTVPLALMVERLVADRARRHACSPPCPECDAYRDGLLDGYLAQP